MNVTAVVLVGGVVGSDGGGGCGCHSRGSVVVSG